MPEPISIHIDATSYKSGELPTAYAHLLHAAQTACERAYAPYSHFWVGAALLLESGEVITGTNQENAAYPSGICAERTAIFWTGANHPDARIVAIAVSARRAEAPNFLPVAPCGACRQALLEYEVKQQADIPIILEAGNGNSVVFSSVASLLPMKFSDKALQGKP